MEEGAQKFWRKVPKTNTMPLALNSGPVGSCWNPHATHGGTRYAKVNREFSNRPSGQVDRSPLKT